MMRCAILSVALLALLAGATTEDKNRPVSKVMTLLKDMIKQLQKEADEDNEVYEVMSCWCTTNDKEKTKAIADGEAAIGMLNSDIEKHAAGSAELNQEIATLQAELAKNQKALDTATSLRQKQLAEFTEEEKDMLQSIGSLGSAVATIAKHHEGALLQLTDREEIDVVSTVQTLLRRHKDILAETITPKQRRIVEAFAQQTAGYFDSASATQKAGAPASGELLGVLKQMKETFETNLAKSQEEESLNNQAYEDMKASKEAEIKAGSDRYAKQSSLLAETDEKHAQAEVDLEETTKTLGEDRIFLASVKEHCVAFDQEYEERTKTRQLEIEAVSKALEFLTSDEAKDLFSRTLGLVQEPAFLQKGAVARRKHLADHLLATAKASHDPRLSTLAQRVRIDAFGKVKESLEGMIDNLLKEKEDEIKHKDFCIDAMNTNKKTTEIKKREQNDAEAKLNDHVNAIKTLTKAIEADDKAIFEMRTQLKRLSEDRAAANKDFQMTVADQQATEKLLSAALGVLKGFYEKAALVQSQAAGAQTEGQPAPPPGFKKRERPSGGVMGMIQAIINDAKAMIAEATTAEEQAQQAYEDTVTNTNKGVKALQEAISQKMEMKAREEEGKVQAEETRDQRLADIEQLMKEDLDLHYNCDYTLKNFELRLTARDEEIEALKQGLATFSGATFSAFLEQY